MCKSSPLPRPAFAVWPLGGKALRQKSYKRLKSLRKIFNRGKTGVDMDCAPCGRQVDRQIYPGWLITPAGNVRSAPDGTSPRASRNARQAVSDNTCQSGDAASSDQESVERGNTGEAEKRRGDVFRRAHRQARKAVFGMFGDERGEQRRAEAGKKRQGILCEPCQRSLLLPPVRRGTPPQAVPTARARAPRSRSFVGRAMNRRDRTPYPARPGAAAAHRRNRSSSHWRRRGGPSTPARHRRR